MSSKYQSSDIEVLTGLEPVRRRPGMYTDTTRPNHLAMEVIDNSVDEALAGFARQITVTVYDDNSVEVCDDGRGMPVDMHPEQGMPGVELILTKLHAGGKFSDKNYQFAGGLHGVGVSVVNALSSRLEIWIKRDGQEHHMSYAHGEKTSELAVTGTVGQRNTGTRIRFWPDPSYFDTPGFSLKRLRPLLLNDVTLARVERQLDPRVQLLFLGPRRPRRLGQPPLEHVPVRPPRDRGPDPTIHVRL